MKQSEAKAYQEYNNKNKFLLGFLKHNKVEGYLFQKNEIVSYIDETSFNYIEVTDLSNLFIDKTIFDQLICLNKEKEYKNITDKIFKVFDEDEFSIYKKISKEYKNITDKIYKNFSLQQEIHHFYKKNQLMNNFEAKVFQKNDHNGSFILGFFEDDSIKGYFFDKDEISFLEKIPLDYFEVKDYSNLFIDLNIFNQFLVLKDFKEYEVIVNKIISDRDLTIEQFSIDKKFHFENNIFYSDEFSINIKEVASIFKQTHYTELIYKGGSSYKYKFSDTEFKFLQKILLNEQEEI